MLLILGRGGSINPARVVAIAQYKSAPVRRLIKETAPERVLDMTYGYPSEGVMLLDNGFWVITNRTPHELARAIGSEESEGMQDDERPPWW